MRAILLAGSVLLAVFYSTDGGATESSMPQAAYGHEKNADLSNGVIGVSMQVGAERIGDPAVLYVAMVHPDGPAHQGGLAHGDEIVTVDGIAVSGKSYEQVVKMVRGTAGTPVKLGVKGDGGMRELSIVRVAAEKLSKGPSGSHGSPSR